jgi:hypothetical protein
MICELENPYILLCDMAQQRDVWVAALKSACGIEEAERLEAQQEQARVDAERREFGAHCLAHCLKCVLCHCIWSKCWRNCDSRDR